MSIWPWIIFFLIVLIMIALDLGLFNRLPRAFTVREALTWSAVWVGLSLLFNLLIYLMYGKHWFGLGENITDPDPGKVAALWFFTGYLVEKSLSLDNIFVIALIFSYFKVPREYQHRVLYWGVLGALVMRGVMIAAGALMMEKFTWTIYLFGAILIVSAIKMLVTSHEQLAPGENLMVRLVGKIFPVSPNFHGEHFFVMQGGRWMSTPLLPALIVVETSDLIFAVDSIPAIFGITSDPFIVFTSNIFAILGLRSLYFALSALMEKMTYLKTSLVYILVFVGVKMMLSHHYDIPIIVTLAVILGILATGGIASLAKEKLKD